MTPQTLTRGMRIFLLVWLGLLISSIGTGLTNFALGVWVYQQTGSVTKFALIALFSALPGALILPLSGALSDRWDRRLTMILSLSGAAVITIIGALLLRTGQLAVWQIYVGVTIRGLFASLLLPAFFATTTLLVPKQHFGRSSGMFQAVLASAQVISPLLAAILIAHLPLQGILAIDFGSYLFALIILLFITIPKPAPSTEGKRGSLLREMISGWTYVQQRLGLLALLFYFATVNLVLGSTMILFTPMILSFASAKVLGTILSISGIGFLCGSFIMSVWGGPKSRVHGVLGFGFVFGLCSLLVCLRPSAILIAIGAFGMYLVLPVVNGCSHAIWQSKIAPDLQGRVFAIRRMIGASTLPIAYLIAGPLADRVFEPLVNNTHFGTIAEVLTGKGPGRGIGLMFIAAGIVIMLAQLGGYLYSPLRRVEFDLPDAVPDMVFTRSR